MSSRGRSPSPRPLDNGDVDMENDNAKTVIVNNLTRNVVESHLRAIFGFYGEITKIDLPVYGKSGQNRGKATVEFFDAASARTAKSHMNGGQIDGMTLTVELTDRPLRSTSRSVARRGRRSSRSLSPLRSRSRSRGPRRRAQYDRKFAPNSYRGAAFDRRGRGAANTYRPYSRSRSRSRSPVRHEPGRLPPRRRSPSYTRGGTGTGYRGRRSRSRSYSVTSSRSRSRSYTRSRSPRSRSRTRSRTRTRSRSYSSYSKDSRSRSRSYSKSKRSYSRDDIRDSRSRSP